MTKAETWPVYETGPHEHLHALGVLMLNFNLYERSLFGVFHHYLAKGSLDPIAFRESQYFIQALRTNAERLKAIDFMASVREPNDKIKCHLKHMIAHFDACLEHRNTLAHAFYYPNVESSHQIDQLRIRKTGKDWSELNEYDLSLPLLRATADHFHAGWRYANNIGMFFAGEDYDDPLFKGLLPSSRDKPPIPRKLKLRRPPNTPATDPLPPQP